MLYEQMTIALFHGFQFLQHVSDFEGGQESLCVASTVGPFWVPVITRSLLYYEDTLRKWPTDNLIQV